VAGTVQESFGSYDIQREVGRGGMGVVYLATDRRLGRRVALKVIVPGLAADPQFRERFEREARVAATLEHPHVVPVYEAGEHEGSLFIAMRFIDGRDLGTEVREHGPLAPRRLARLIVQVAGALDAAHRAGVVHRDVKPANILLTGAGDDEHAYLTDFGLTREAASESGLTVTGQWVGTVDYAAPEQILGEPTDARSDVYALGCTVFHALTGQPPYQGVPAARLYAHMNNPPPSACESRAGLYPEVDVAIGRAMAKDPGERFQSAGDFARALEAALTGEPNLEPERTVAAGPALTGAPQRRDTGALTRESPTAAAPAGDATRVAAAGTTRVAPADTQPPAPTNRARQPRVLAAAAVILVVAAAAVVALLVGGGDDKSYADKVADALAGLARANSSLSERFSSLTAGTPHATIESATAATAAAERDARGKLSAVDAGDDRALAGQLTSALGAERAFLDQAAKAAASPTSADPSAIQSAGDRMRSAFAAISSHVGDLAAVGGVGKLADWVRRRQGGARIGTFVRDVDAILAQARPGRQRISQVAGAIQNGSITPSDARTGIVEVVANREAALAAARGLAAPDDATGDVKNKLVEAFRRSLDNDRDFQDGIAAYASGDFTRFATKVYDDAFASNDAATAAKKQFLDAYNALRAKRGLPPVADDF
jgi:predicted Ser/Thr protein kinase